MRKQEEVRLAEEKTRQSELEVHRGQQEAVSRLTGASNLLSSHVDRRLGIQVHFGLGGLRVLELTSLCRHPMPD